MKWFIISIILIFATPFHIAFINLCCKFNILPSIFTLAAATLCLIYPLLHHKLWTGFITGILLGSISGANLSQYVISYTLTAYLLHFLTDISIERKRIVYAVYIILWSISAQILLVFFAPPLDIGNIFYTIYQSTLSNGFIGVMIYPFTKQYIKPKRMLNSSLKGF